MIKKIPLLFLFFFSFSYAQFIEEKPPTKFELALNNATKADEIHRLAYTAFEAKKHKEYLLAIQKLAVLRPFDAVIQYKLAEAFSLNLKRTEAFNALINIQKQGLYFDIASNENFDNINKFPVFKYIKDNMDVANNHYGEGQEVFFIDKSFSGLLYESISYDRNSQSFLLGSLRDGSILKVAADGKISTLVSPSKGGKSGPWSIIDLAVDEKSDVLWATSSAVTQFGKLTKETIGLAGVFKYQLSTGKLLDSYLLPEKQKPFLLTSIAITNNSNDIYLVETFHNSVIKLNTKTKVFQPLFSSEKFNNLKNIVLSENGSHLYFNDIELGLYGMDMATNKFFQLGSYKTLNATGVSDLIYDDGKLFLVQSGTTPQRVMRIELNEAKNQIRKSIPIEASHPRFNSPSYGLALGEHIYYISNSQLPKTNQFGGLEDGQKWENMYIIRSNNNFNEEGNKKLKEEVEKLKNKVGAN